MLKRYASAALIASGVTFGLFFLMQVMITMSKGGLSDDEAIRFVDLVQSEHDEEVRREDRKPEKPPEPEIPPDVDIPQDTSLRPDDMSVNMQVASVGADVNLNASIFGGIQEGEYLPIVKVQPVYPRRAQERGIGGQVMLEFTVTELGTTENHVVVWAEPKGYFERAAINAAKKFKYKPKVVNGQPVPVAGVRNLITFEMAED